MNIVKYYGNNTPPNSIATEFCTLEGTCVECGKGKYKFIADPELIKKYTGQIREILLPENCICCGGYLWLISIPPENNKLDDILNNI